MLIYKGKLNNIFKRGDFQEKTGEVKEGKYQLEFITQKEVIKGQGFETVIEKISIPDNLYNEYKSKVGQEVQVKVGAMSSNKRVILYGVE